ncbi:MAG: DUF2934 domain-containing protein [Stellaceae bacterium]
MESDRERLIRERAYEIWESEGRPKGRDVEHWRQAAAEIAAAAPAAATPPAPAPQAPPQRRSRAVPRRERGNGTATARRKPEAP